MCPSWNENLKKNQIKVRNNLNIKQEKETTKTIKKIIKNKKIKAVAPLRVK